MPSGLFIVAIDLDESKRARFRSWYEAERIPAVLKVPGVTGVTQWQATERLIGGESGGLVAVPAFPAYVVMYELADVDVVRTDAFLDAYGREYSNQADVYGEQIEYDTYLSATMSDLTRRANPGQEETPARGLLIVSITPQRDYTPAFHEWYEKVHLDELLACPGYLRTRRLTALDGFRTYFALYYLDDIAAMKSEKFLATSGRTFEELPPEFQYIAPHMTGNLCDIYQLLD